MCDLLVDTKHYVLNKSTRLVCGLLWSLCSRLAFKAVEQIQRRSSGGEQGRGVHKCGICISNFGHAFVCKEKTEASRVSQCNKRL